MSDSGEMPTAKLGPSSTGVRFAFGGRAGQVLQDHFERDVHLAVLSAKFKLYYRLRPFIPIPLRQWLQRGRNQSIEVSQSWYLPIDFLNDFQTAIEREGDAVAIHPWPDGFQMAVSLTHDIETAQGMKWIDQLAAMEEKLGLRSSWNVVPYKYKVDPCIIKDLQQRGHEVGIQGYNHDGRLYESRRTFMRRSGSINKAIAKYGSVGFRSPMVHRNFQWLQDLDVQYDASSFDTDPFQAMPGGVGGVWPFMVGKFVELPYTLPQDHTLMVSLGETTPRIWLKKLEFLRSMAGMAMVITHPDYLDSPKRLEIYRRFLDHVAEQTDCWKALPRDVASWWRQRDELEIVDDRIVGSLASRARLWPLHELAAIMQVASPTSPSVSTPDALSLCNEDTF
ncbi:hypothetical protein [Planctomycetes bacterium CA13]